MKAPRGRVTVREHHNALSISDVRTGFSQIYRRNAQTLSFATAAADIQMLNRMGVRVTYLHGARV